MAIVLLHLIYAKIGDKPSPIFAQVFETVAVMYSLLLFLPSILTSGHSVFSMVSVNPPGRISGRIYSRQSVFLMVLMKRSSADTFKINYSRLSIRRGLIINLGPHLFAELMSFPMALMNSARVDYILRASFEERKGRPGYWADRSSACRAGRCQIRFRR